MHGIKAILIVEVLFNHSFSNFIVIFLSKIAVFAKYPSFYAKLFDGSESDDDDDSLTFKLQVDNSTIWISSFFIIRFDNRFF